MTGRISRWSAISLRPMILMLVIVAGCGSSDEADEGGARSSAASITNAADEYRRIYAALDPALVEACKDLEDLPALSMELQEDLDTNGELIEDLVAASMVEECDFGTDYSLGDDVIVPHLVHMRSMALVLRADALRYANVGDPDGAARRLGAIIRMAQHLAESDPIVLSKLVGFAMLMHVQESADELMSYDMLDAAARRSLREELSRIDARDPLGAKGAIAFELQSAILIIRETRGFSETLGIDLSPLSDAHREEAISQLRDAFARIEAVWDSPNAVEQITDITESLTSPLARVAIAATDLYREQVDLAAQRLREFIERLEP